VAEVGQGVVDPDLPERRRGFHEGFHDAMPALTPWIGHVDPGSTCSVRWSRGRVDGAQTLPRPLAAAFKGASDSGPRRRKAGAAPRGCGHRVDHSAASTDWSTVAMTLSMARRDTQRARIDQLTTTGGTSMGSSIRRQTTGAVATGASVTGATAIGARILGPSAMGPLAIAVAAVGALAIGRLAIADAVIRKLRAEEVEIGSLKVRELEVAGQRWPASTSSPMPSADQQ